MTPLGNRVPTGLLAGVFALLLLFLGLRLMTGIYVDDEWGDHFWFVKHQPSWQFAFSPVLPNGHEASDIARLSAADKAAHDLFSTTVKDRRFEVSIPSVIGALLVSKGPRD